MLATGLIVMATVLYALAIYIVASLLSLSQLASLVLPESRHGRQIFNLMTVALAPLVIVAVSLIGVVCWMTYVSYRLHLVIFDDEALQAARQLAQQPKLKSRQDVDEHTLETYPR